MSREPTFQNALAFAQDLIRIPSLSGQEGMVAKRVMEEMVALGYDEVRVDALGNVIGVVRGTAGAPPVMLNCHMDVVAEGDHGDWEYPPFGGAVAQGFLHGRGAMDIKGPLAVQTYAGAALKGKAEGDVIVAHTVFEERGGWGMEALLAGKEVEPAAVIIGEATQGDITTGHRGRAEVEVVLRGEAGHASDPRRARNALDLLPPVLRGLGRLAENQPEDPVLGRASLAPTGVEVFPESRNVIPDQVVVVVDWRILPDSTDEALLEAVRGAVKAELPTVPDGMGVEARMATEVQSSYTGLSERRDLLTPGFLMAPDDPLVVEAARAVGRRNGSGPATIRPWTFATDGGWSRGIYGIPTIGFAAGEERFAHTNRERWDLAEAEWALARHPALIRAVQGTLP
jgi:putative selenium metabolism hydrolase